ncbi:MAG: hypothetical protein ACHQ9S_13020 [Candidatus Binatia bacterium]
MDVALRGTVALDQKKRDGERDEECIISVHPAVLEHVGHTFGNLFQRIYHLIEQLRRSDATGADHLGSSIGQLEAFLQLVIDYFSPLSLTLQRVCSADVAESLARQIGDMAGCSVKIEGKGLGGNLLADPGELARAFGLLAKQLVRENVDPNELIQLSASERRSGRSLVLQVDVQGRVDSRRSSEAEMQWAVAQKILETHGGTLQQHAKTSGETSWEIALPLQF